MIHRLLINIIIHLIFFLFLISLLHASYFDWEDINKTMVAFEQLFKTDNDTYLKNLSSYTFKKETKKFNKLKKYIKNYFINLSEVREVCSKYFPIVKGDYDGYTLIIDFSRQFVNNTERYWFIEDAYLQKNDSQNNYYFEMRGFSANAIEYYFSDILKEIMNNNMSYYSGLVKYGKLNPSFFTNNKIVLNENTTINISNIIIYSNQKVEDIIFIKLSYIKNGDRDIRGWIISDFGSMYEKICSEQEGFALFATQNTSWNDFLQHKSKTFNFKKNSPYMYTNIAQLENKDNTLNNKTQLENTGNTLNNKETSNNYKVINENETLSESSIQLTKIFVSSISWDSNHLYLKIDLKNFNYDKNKEFQSKNILPYLQYNAIDGKIKFVFKKQIIECTGILHKYLNIYCKDHLLEVRPNVKAPYYLTDSSRINLFRIEEIGDQVSRLSFSLDYKMVHFY